MTPKVCNDLCDGYDYFGVQMTECFCGNSYGSVSAYAVENTANGNTADEKGQAQYAYETAAPTTEGKTGVGLVVGPEARYLKEGCYYDCEQGDGSYPCGGHLRNSVYRRPSTMPADCVNTDSELLNQRGVCNPDAGALAAPVSHAEQPTVASHSF